MRTKSQAKFCIYEFCADFLYEVYTFSVKQYNGARRVRTAMGAVLSAVRFFLLGGSDQPDGDSLPHN